MNSRILTFGEVLLRLSPSNNQRIKEMHSIDMSLGGAESNVAIALSYLGHSTEMLSAVPENDLGHRVLSELSSHFVSTKSIFKTGERLGIYYYESGSGMRSSNVIYDRENTSINKLINNNTLNCEKILSGVSTLHISGITCALSKEIDNFVYQLVKTAKSMKVKVSFDFNFRSKLWSLEDARKSYLRILPFVDYCFAGFDDFSSIMNNKNNKHEIYSEERLLEYYLEYHELYDIEYFASTKREIISASENRIQGLLFNNNKLYKTETTTFPIEERIGAGDAFAAGILHGITHKWENDRIIEFGTMSGMLKHSLKGDFSNLTEEDILQQMKAQTQGVKR